MRIDDDRVRAAGTLISGHIRRTPVMRAELSTARGPADTVFKLEFTQLGGCFKVRGSIAATLAARRAGTLTDAGVLVASGGNAAIGAAWAARTAGVACRVVVPATAPSVKVEALRALGARVDLVGSRYQHAADAAAQIADDTGALLLHAYDHPDVVAGAGTIGLELAEDVTGPLTIVACVGGGGLLAGLVACLRPGDRVVGVEPVGAACLHQALAAGRPVPVELDSVAADSLGATRVGSICWATVSGRDDVDSVLVTDADIIEARSAMWDEHRLLIEHGTATAVAAVRTGQVLPEPGSTLCVVLCGANTALAL